MTFKISDLKENIEYVVLKHSFSNTPPLLRKVIGKDFFEKRDNGWSKTGILPCYIYDSWEFTCQYPETIEEAAKILDAHFPDWAAKINLDVYSQSNGKNCILGQLYSTYFNGMEHLFDFKMEYIYSKKINLDKVFGTNASSKIWQQQINLRLNKEVKTMTFLEAVEALMNGKKVTLNHWNGDYLTINSDCYVKNSRDSYIPHLFMWKNRNDWRIIETIKFSDIKSGEKFKHLDKTWIKAKKDGFAIDSEDYLNIIELKAETNVEKV